ncbi:hypothetical protein AMAG_14455 [Allomyces macrogynus ATCC 38327]|uniref:Uncharacterized protein n=1 Tax=Allomyces macrogynus (strain ATCC 38327) TaxID=578462 RepID=A0A0L0T6U9_ALLM3|nr:hypothetical protein AMAG_14455 [Allomyces macrogynus ATCC 38327]|eukprot:KNE70309.1 hypothetical protein AMAG_14455 [Allomyces macrogynus ATCC 38327]
MSKVAHADQAVPGTPARAGTPTSRTRSPRAPSSSSPTKRAPSPTRPRHATTVVVTDDDDMAALERAASMIRASLPLPENDAAFRPDSADPAGANAGLIDETVRRTLLQRRAPVQVRPALKQVHAQVAAAYVADVSDAKSVHLAVDEVVSPQTGSAWLAAAAAMQPHAGEVGAVQTVQPQTQTQTQAQPASRKASLKIDTDHVPQYPPATHHPAAAVQIQQRGYDADNDDDDDTSDDDHLVDQRGEDDDDEDDDIPLQAMRATTAAAARPPSVAVRVPSPVVESPDSPLIRTSAGGSGTTKAPPPILKGSLLSPSKYSHAVRGTQPALQLPLGPPSPMTPEVEEEELEVTPAEDNIPLSLVHRSMPAAPMGSGMDMNAMSMMMAGMRMGMMMGMGMPNSGMMSNPAAMGMPNPAMMMQQMYPGAYNPYAAAAGHPPPIWHAPVRYGSRDDGRATANVGRVGGLGPAAGCVRQGMPPAVGFMQMPPQYPQPQQFMAPPMPAAVATEGKKSSKKDKEKKKEKKEHRSSSRSRSRSRSPTRTDAPSELESVPPSPAKDNDKKRSHHQKDKDGKDKEKSKSKSKDKLAAEPEPPRGRSPTPAPGHAANEAALATELRVNTTKPKVATAVRSPDYVSATSTNSSAHTPIRQRLVTTALVKDRISTMESRKEKED